MLEGLRPLSSSFDDSKGILYSCGIHALGAREEVIDLFSDSPDVVRGVFDLHSDVSGICNIQCALLIESTIRDTKIMSFQAT